MIRKRSLAFLLILCLAAPAVTACSAGGPEYDDEGELIIPPRVQTIMDRALENVKSGGVNLNGKFANWHRDMIDSGLKTGYTKYDEELEILNRLRVGAHARNAYILYDYDAENDEYIISMHTSRDQALPFDSKREATHAIREAFEGRGTAEKFAWNYGDNDYPLLSAFMPVYDENADIIAVLGLDIPALAVRSSPEWNRDSKKWNGLTE
jgi:hypothetical protein